MQIPLFATSLDPHRDRSAEALLRVAASDRFILGPEVEAFERELADYLSNDPDAVIERLAAAGVQARGYYRTPVYRQPAMARFASAELPVTDRVASSNVALPMGPELTQEHVSTVATACRKQVAA